MNNAITSEIPENDQSRILPTVFFLSVLIHILLITLLGLIKAPLESLPVMELSMMKPTQPIEKPIPRHRIKPRNTRVIIPGGPAMKTPEINNPSVLPPPALPDTAPADSPGDVHVPAVPAEQVGFHDGSVEKLGSPDGTGEKAGIGTGVGQGQGINSKTDYFNLVRKNIEANKIYPEKARRRMIEGRVTVQFIIMDDGHVSSVKIVKHSGDMSIDKAALKAVGDSSPFVQPPAGLFAGSLPVEITLVFELI